MGLTPRDIFEDFLEHNLASGETYTFIKDNSLFADFFRNNFFI